MKKSARIFFLFAFTLVSCAPGSSITLPPDVTLIPGTDIPQQVATYVSSALTQTSNPPATSTPYFAMATLPAGNEPGSSSFPTPVNFASQILYQSSSLGIQFSYPSAWYRQETSDGVFLSSFDPINPPHKLEWGYDTTSMQFGINVFIMPPGSFDEWVENERQTAYSNQLTISEEERFSIATQQAHRLSLVSGSGGVINRVLTEINGRHLEINVEGNYNNNLARVVLDSIQPFSSSGLKPADMVTPAAGVCGDALGDLVNITLGLDASGMPLAGRCIAIHPSQRIRLINQANGPFGIKFADYIINLPVGGDLLLDQPIGQYLALGVHFLPMGPELWVKTTISPTFTPIPPPVITAPPPIVEYSNSGVGYRLNLPGDWVIDETNSTSKEVIFSPPYAEPFIAYLSVILDSRTLDQVINYYAQNMSVLNVVREDTIFNGYSAVKYIYANGRNEYYIPYGNQLVLISTDRPNNETVQSILMTFRFMAPPQPFTYYATLADNGRTFYMNIGDKLRLDLDYGYTWSMVSISNPAVIAGAQDGYFAFTSGTATLTTIGDPGCLNSTPPCAIPSIKYTITVIVR